MWQVLAILLILWLLGFGLHVGGGLIHIVLVVFLVLLLIHVVSLWERRQ
jgi:hypothetical protein